MMAKYSWKLKWKYYVSYMVLNNMERNIPPDIIRYELERIMALLKRVWPIMFVIIFVAGCKTTAQDVTPTTHITESEPTRISPALGFGGITGSVSNGEEFWSGVRLVIYAAEYYGESGEEGVFLLEPMLFPKSILNEEFSFQINNVPPKKYLLLVGPNPESSLFIRQEGKPLIIEVKANQIVDIGEVEVGE
jgi:hypothetical protein